MIDDANLKPSERAINLACQRFAGIMAREHYDATAAAMAREMFEAVALAAFEESRAMILDYIARGGELPATPPRTKGGSTCHPPRTKRGVRFRAGPPPPRRTFDA